jgi:hypothetical protein
MKVHRLRVSENRALTRRLGPTSDKVTRDRRRMYNAELQYLYSSPNITVKREIGGACGTYGEEDSA